MGFYKLLGFTPENTLRDERGKPFWSLMQTAGGAAIMLARASGPINAEEQAVLFYMYSQNIAALREHLLAGGLHDGGIYYGQPGPNGGRRVVFAVKRQDYMPAGEMRVADPDGYCILIGQLG